MQESWVKILKITNQTRTVIDSNTVVKNLRKQGLRAVKTQPSTFTLPRKHPHLHSLSPRCSQKPEHQECDLVQRRQDKKRSPVLPAC